MNVLDKGQLLYKERAYYIKFGILNLITGSIILTVYLITLKTRTPYDDYMWIFEYIAFGSFILIWIFLGGYYWNKLKSHIIWIYIYENGITIQSNEDYYFIPFDKIIKHKGGSIDKDRRYFEIESEDGKNIRIGNHPSIEGINFISKNIDAMDSIIYNKIEKK